MLDSVDQADLVNEKEHQYALSVKHIGFVFMKLLPNPARPREDLWDAARIVPPGVSESFRLRNLALRQTLVLILRSAPTIKAEFDVLSSGKTLGHARLTANDGWVETRVTLPAPGAPEVTPRIRAQQDGARCFKSGRSARFELTVHDARLAAGRRGVGRTGAGFVVAALFHRRTREALESTRN